VRRFFCLILMMLLLTGCAASEPIVGSWEEEITISVLGIGQSDAEAAAVTRFLFRENGSGSWAMAFADGSHPEAVREFSYSLEEDVLTLTFKQEDHPIQFTMTLTGDSLRLENDRGTFHLIRTE